MADFRLVATEHGDSGVIRKEGFEPTPPGPGEALVRHTAVGVNFIDIYHRRGVYPMPLPVGLGTEAAGIVEAIGAGVEGVTVGQRVAYVTNIPGSYATSRTVAADLLIPLPDTVSDELAAAALLKGLTAEFLIFRCAESRRGDYALVHAAAGGVGIILVQWLASIGVHVIAHAGSAAKAAMAFDAGATLALDCDYADLAAEVREHSEGAGVHVSFDGVGVASWAASIASLRRRGLMISFGNASGAVPPITPLELSKNGSLFLTRPTMFDYLVTKQERQAAAKHLLDALGDGTLKVEIGQRFALEDAAKAHDALEGRRTTGSTILTI